MYLIYELNYTYNTGVWVKVSFSLSQYWSLKRWSHRCVQYALRFFIWSPRSIGLFSSIYTWKYTNASSSFKFTISLIWLNWFKKATVIWVRNFKSKPAPVSHFDQQSHIILRVRLTWTLKILTVFLSKVWYNYKCIINTLCLPVNLS